MGDIAARGMASAALESIQNLRDQITSIEVGPGVQNFKGWGYQDFPSISETSVTITDNENGEVTFDASKIINNTACIVLASNGDKVPYTGIIKLFSTRVQVNSNTGASVTLNAVPHSTYGALRVYYYYNYSAGIPENYSIAPKTVGANLFAELDNNFATDEELAAAIANIPNYVNDQNITTGVTQVKIWTGTQAEYDAVGSKDAATLYFIKS